MPDPIPLAQAHCIPCKGREHRPGSARRAELLPQVPGWPLGENGQALLRTFHFPDYRHTIAFVNALARIAHRENHHPDLSVHCGRCEVCYSTHDLGSLSANDFICAARAGALVD